MPQARELRYGSSMGPEPATRPAIPHGEAQRAPRTPRLRTAPHLREGGAAFFTRSQLRVGPPGFRSLRTRTHTHRSRRTRETRLSSVVSAIHLCYDVISAFFKKKLSLLVLNKSV